MSEDCYGPALPPQLKKSEEIGPALPPKLQKSIIGPALPPHLQKTTIESDEDTQIEENEEEIIGPVLPGCSGNSQTQRALEERALELKLGYLDSGDKKPEREEWMIELPEGKSKNLGLGPRQFRKNAAPDMSDRSSWTDTPDKKAKKLAGKHEEKIDLKKEAAQEEVRKRDKEQEKLAKQHNKKKKRDQSLMEMHQETLKKKKKEEEKDAKAERKPFNRETDLQVNRFDEAQKKAILKKAAILDDRFSRGEAKFL